MTITPFRNRQPMVFQRPPVAGVIPRQIIEPQLDDATRIALDLPNPLPNVQGGFHTSDRPPQAIDVPCFLDPYIPDVQPFVIFTVGKTSPRHNMMPAIFEPSLDDVLKVDLFPLPITLRRQPGGAGAVRVPPIIEPSASPELDELLPADPFPMPITLRRQPGGAGAVHVPPVIQPLISPELDDQTVIDASNYPKPSTYRMPPFTIWIWQVRVQPIHDEPIALDASNFPQPYQMRRQPGGTGFISTPPLIEPSVVPLLDDVIIVDQANPRASFGIHGATHGVFRVPPIAVQVVPYLDMPLEITTASEVVQKVNSITGVLHNPTIAISQAKWETPAPAWDVPPSVSSGPFKSPPPPIRIVAIIASEIFEDMPPPNPSPFYLRTTVHTVTIAAVACIQPLVVPWQPPAPDNSPLIVSVAHRSQRPVTKVVIAAVADMAFDAIGTLARTIAVMRAPRPPIVVAPIDLTTDSRGVVITQTPPQFHKWAPPVNIVQADAPLPDNAAVLIRRGNTSVRPNRPLIVSQSEFIPVDVAPSIEQGLAVTFHQPPRMLALAPVDLPQDVLPQVKRGVFLVQAKYAPPAKSLAQETLPIDVAPQTFVGVHTSIRPPRSIIRQPFEDLPTPPADPTVKRGAFLTKAIFAPRVQVLTQEPPLADLNFRLPTFITLGSHTIPTGGLGVPIPLTDKDTHVQTFTTMAASQGASVGQGQIVILFDSFVFVESEPVITDKLPP